MKLFLMTASNEWEFSLKINFTDFLHSTCLTLNSFHFILQKQNGKLDTTPKLVYWKFQNNIQYLVLLKADKNSHRPMIVFVSGTVHKWCHFRRPCLWSTEEGSVWCGAPGACFNSLSSDCKPGEQSKIWVDIQQGGREVGHATVPDQVRREQTGPFTDS